MAFEFYEVTFVLCAYGFDMLPFLWNYAANDILGPEYSLNEILISVLFMFILVMMNIIRYLPWEIYFNFVIEEKHGFNKQTIIEYFIDKIKMVNYILFFN